MDLETLKLKIKDLGSDEAIKVLDEYISHNPRSEQAYTIRGMKHWGAGHRAAAINDFLAAIRINPESPAREALKASNEILDYRNKDLYNP